MAKKIPGFCYVTHKPLELTSKEWRERYPPTTHLRQVLGGDTLYRATVSNGRRLVAEAYAIIPEGK